MKENQKHPLKQYKELASVMFLNRNGITDIEAQDYLTKAARLMASINYTINSLDKNVDWSKAEQDTHTLYQFYTELLPMVYAICKWLVCEKTQRKHYLMYELEKSGIPDFTDIHQHCVKKPFPNSILSPDQLTGEDLDNYNNNQNDIDQLSV